MITGVAVLLMLALAAANLPFIADRLLFVFPLKKQKNIAWHLLELVVLYFIVGGVSMLLESKAAPLHSQKWEFYAVTTCLFLVFAFPGFTYRYLWRKH